MNCSPFRSSVRVLSVLSALFVSALSLVAVPPTITQQPAVVVANAGASASFSVVASGSGTLGYQWRHLGTPIVGADQPSLVLPGVELADAGFYDVVVTSGAESTVSQPGRLLVQPVGVADVYRADPTFGFVAERGGAFVAATKITTDGAVLAGGAFTTLGGARRDSLVRLTSAFAIDSSFAPSVAGAVYAIAELPDGRIVIGGGFTHVNGVPRSCIARLNIDGSLDATFFPGAGFNGNVFALQLQPDGRMVVGGGFSTADGAARGCIARLNADGSLDATFANGAGFNGAVRSLVRQSDGKLVAGGYFSLYDGTNTAGRLARLDVDGAFDGAFATTIGTGANDGVEAVAVLADDSLLVAGTFTGFNGVAANRAVRLSAGGVRDTTFTVPAFVNGALRAIAPAPSNRVWIAGDYSSATQRFLNRLNADGSNDTTWAPASGAKVNATIYAVAGFADGRVAAGGTFTQFGGTANSASGLARYSNTGTLQSSPGGGFRQAAVVLAAVPAPGDQWVIGGTFTHINGTARNQIARISSSGAVDATFNPGTGFNGPVAALALQGDGRILAAGSFSYFNGVEAYGTARLETDGTLDTGFSLDVRIQGDVEAFQLQPDGRIVIGGGFATFYGGTRNSVARLYPDGSLDESFDLGAGTSGPVRTLALQRDGAVVVGGDFTQLNGTARGAAARLGPTGALDSTFNNGAGFDAAVSALALRADDSAVVAGAFLNANGTARRGAAAFALGGSLSGTFNAGSGLEGGEVLGVTLLADGRAFFAGKFTAAGGQPVRGLARIAANGTVDAGFATFDTSLGNNSGVIVTGDGRLLVLNTTTAFSSGRHLGLAMLRADASPLPLVVSGPVSQTVVTGANVTFSVSAGGAPTLRYQWRKDGADLLGATTATLSLSTVTPSAAGSYSVVVRNDYGRTEVAATLGVVSVTSYAGWAVAHFSASELGNPAISGVGADPDGAGVSNLTRYAFGLSARGPVAAPSRGVLVDDGALRYAAVVFNRVAAADDLVYTVQASGDLTNWTTVTTLGAGLPIEQTVRDTVPVSSANRRFLRVRVELVP